jgi:hypothetical protein
MESFKISSSVNPLSIKACRIPYKLPLNVVRSGRIKAVTVSKGPMIPAATLHTFVQEANRPNLA